MHRITDTQDRQKLKYIRLVLIGGSAIALLKFAAFYITNSNAILTDALESLINLAAGLFALYSVYLAAKPKDKDHPYGHGKIEFFSAGFEGALICIAGIGIIGKSIYAFFYPPELSRIDIGIAITFIGGLGNFIMGRFLIVKGKQLNSITLEADGKHLVTDTLSSIGLVAGLVIIYFTNIIWLDSVLAIMLGGIILFTGAKLVRNAFAGLMDEADEKVIENMIDILNHNRRDKWIDIHNFRVIKYGGHLHIDCHITLPWYDDLKDIHREVKDVESLMQKKMDGRVEFFIHSDPCVPESCTICQLKDCKVRQHPFAKKIRWNMGNVLSDKKHEA